MMNRDKRVFDGYVRGNGSVGVRNILLAMSSVVCANRAAQLAAEAVLSAVSIEHPLGCAQIGSDKEQTFRTLAGIGAHPNVQHVVVIGLGCEGIAALTIVNEIKARGRSASLLSIQDVGGTSCAASQGADYLTQHATVPDKFRTTLSIEDLVVGVGYIDDLGASGRDIVDALIARGARVLKTVEKSLPTTIEYAMPFPADQHYATMRAFTGDSESITGLVAAGAQVVLAQADLHHLGGHGVCPVVRIGYDPHLSAALADDMDAMVSAMNADAWVNFLLEVASGKQTASEVLGTQLFAIERLGPTL